MLCAEAYHFEILLEVKLEGPDRLLDVIGRFCDPRQRNDGVGLYHFGLKHLVVLEDVALAEGKAVLPLVRFEIGGGDIEAVDLPIGFGENIFQQMCADEAVYSGDE